MYIKCLTDLYILRSVVLVTIHPFKLFQLLTYFKFCFVHANDNFNMKIFYCFITKMNGKELQF
jgi:hypothetical protein